MFFDQNLLDLDIGLNSNNLLLEQRLIRSRKIEVNDAEEFSILNASQYTNPVMPQRVDRDWVKTEVNFMDVERNLENFGKSQVGGNGRRDGTCGWNLDRVPLSKKDQSAYTSCQVLSWEDSVCKKIAYMKILGKRVGDYDDHTFAKPRILNYGVVYDRHPFKKMNDYLYLVAAEPARLNLFSICDEKEIYSFNIP